MGSVSGLQIGRSYDGVSPLDGRIDDLMIFDEALTQEQIRKLMSSKIDGLPFAKVGASEGETQTGFFRGGPEVDGRG